MKNKLTIGGTILLLAIMLAPLSIVLATEQTPPLTIHDHQTVWTIDLVHGPITVEYSGKDVVDVDAFVTPLVPNPDFDPSLPPDPITNPEFIPGEDVEVDVLKTSVTDVQVKIWVDPEDLPEKAESTYVIIDYLDANGVVQTDTGITGGPGWAFAWGR